MAHRILIVDDNRDEVRLLHSALDSLEYEFEIVEIPSGEEAFLEISLNKFDLAVIDYLLPGMSGLELMAKIRAHNPEVQTILISVSKEGKTHKELREADAFSFFQKPISLPDFLDAVERSLGLKRTVLPIKEESDENLDANKNISDLFSKFRQNMDAQAIYLLSDEGDVLIRKGMLTDSSLEVSLLSGLMSIRRTGQKVSGFIHQKTPLSYHIFPGGDQDILLVPINTAYVIIVAGQKLAERKKVLDLIDALMMLKSEVEKHLKKEGFPEEQIEDDSTFNELDTLLEQKTEIQTDELSSFWDKAVDNQKTQQIDVDKLSYEQAQRLGLTPENEF